MSADQVLRHQNLSLVIWTTLKSCTKLIWGQDGTGGCNSYRTQWYEHFNTFKEDFVLSSMSDVVRNLAIDGISLFSHCLKQFVISDNKWLWSGRTLLTELKEHYLVSWFWCFELYQLSILMPLLIRICVSLQVRILNLDFNTYSWNLVCLKLHKYIWLKSTRIQV